MDVSGAKRIRDKQTAWCRLEACRDSQFSAALRVEDDSQRHSASWHAAKPTRKPGLPQGILVVGVALAPRCISRRRRLEGDGTVDRTLEEAHFLGLGVIQE